MLLSAGSVVIFNSAKANTAFGGHCVLGLNDGAYTGGDFC